MDFMSTVKGSLLEGFYPKGWDMAKIDACCEMGVKREEFWNEGFTPIDPSVSISAIGKVGKDKYGEYVVEKLNAKGIDTRGVIFSKSEKRPRR